MGQVLHWFLCSCYVQYIVAVGIIQDSTIDSYFHRSSAVVLGLVFGTRLWGPKAAKIHHLLELWGGLIFLTEVILTALFGLVLRTSISIKSDTDYLQMRCAWTIRNLNIFQTSLGFVMCKSWVKAFLESPMLARKTCDCNQNIRHSCWVPPLASSDTFSFFPLFSCWNKQNMTFA